MARMNIVLDLKANTGAASSALSSFASSVAKVGQTVASVQQKFQSNVGKKKTTPTVSLQLETRNLQEGQAKLNQLQALIAQLNADGKNVKIDFKQSISQSDRLKFAVEALRSGFRQAASSGMALAKIPLPAALKPAVSLFNTLKSSISAYGAKLGTGLTATYAFYKVWWSIKDAFKNPSTALSSFASKVKGAFAGTGPALSGFRSGLAKIGAGLIALSPEFGKMVSIAGQAFSKLLSAAKTAALGMHTTIKNSLQGIVKGMTTIIDSARLVAQGMMSIGRAWSFYVTAPITAALAWGFKGALDFEQAMIRVRKTTGLWGDQLKVVNDGLQKMALSTVSSQTELAAMAEQIGQVGVTNPKSILELVQLLEMLVQATDVTSDDVAISMGQIANAFGWNLNQTTDEIYKFANVLNFLENTTAATAQDILSGVYSFAPVAGMLKIPAADAAAMIATLVSLGMSADDAGTRLGAMYQQMIKNADKFAKIVAGSTEKYKTIDDVYKAMNEDATAVFADLVDMMSRDEDRAQALAAAFDLTGRVGGKALGAAAGNAQLLAQTLQQARQQWQYGSSLLQEYNLSLQSASAHFSILKNNLQQVAITLGNTFLPIISRAIEFIVPGLRMIAAAVGNASARMKLFAAVGVAAALALGPLLFIGAQFVFGLTMIGLGITKVVGLVFGLISAFTGLIATLVSVVTGIGSLVMGVIGFIGQLIAFGPVGIVLGLVVALLSVVGAAGAAHTALGALGKGLASFFGGLAKDAVSWGSNLIKSFTDGIVKGATKFLNSVMTWIGNLISGYLESHSPPKVGPLSTMDVWGTNLMNTFLRGFLLADFDILKKVTSTIKNIFDNFVSAKLFDKGKAGQALLAMRENLAKLINVFNDTGQIDATLLDAVVADLGDAKDEVKELVSLYLQYEQLQRRIKDNEEAKQQAEEQYIDEAQAIMNSNLTAEEKAVKLREAMIARDDRLRQLDEEGEALSDEAELLQQRIAWQEAFIESLQEESDIMQDILDTLDELKNDTVEVSGPVIEPDLQQKIDDIGQSLGDWVSKINSFETGVRSAQSLLAAFWGGLTGQVPDPVHVWNHDDVDPGPLSPNPENQGEQDYWTFYNAGSSVHQGISSLIEKLTTLKDSFLLGWNSGNPNSDTDMTFYSLGNRIRKIKDSVLLDLILLQLALGDDGDLATNLASFFANMLGLDDTADSLNHFADSVENFNEAWSKLKELLGGGGADPNDTGGPIDTMLSNLVEGAGNWLDQQTGGLNFWIWLLGGEDALKEYNPDFKWPWEGKTFSEWFFGIPPEFKWPWEEGGAWHPTMQSDDAPYTPAPALPPGVGAGGMALGPLFTIDLIPTMVQGLADLSGWVDQNRGTFGRIVGGLRENIPTNFDDLWNGKNGKPGLKSKFSALLTDVDGWISGNETSWGKKFGPLGEAVATGIGDVWNGSGGANSGVKGKINLILSGIDRWITEKENPVQVAFSVVGGWISSGVGDVWNGNGSQGSGVKGKINTILSGIDTWISTNENPVEGKFNPVKTWIARGVGDIWNGDGAPGSGVKGKINTILSGLDSWINNPQNENSVTGNFTRLVGWITNGLSGIKQAVISKLMALLGINDQDLQQIKKFFEDQGKKIAQWITDGFGSISLVANIRWVNPPQWFQWIIDHWPHQGDNPYGTDRDTDDEPGAATGGIVTRPMKIWVGEGRESEAIIPLSQLPSMVHSISGMNYGGAEMVQININHPVVREEQDIRKIVSEVENTINRKLDQSRRYRGG